MDSRIPFALPITACFTLAFSLLVHADTVILNDGRQISGSILSRTSSQICIVTESTGRTHILLKDIREINGSQVGTRPYGVATTVPASAPVRPQASESQAQASLEVHRTTATRPASSRAPADPVFQLAPGGFMSSGPASQPNGQPRYAAVLRVQVLTPIQLLTADGAHAVKADLAVAGLQDVAFVSLGKVCIFKLKRGDIVQVPCVIPYTGALPNGRDPLGRGLRPDASLVRTFVAEIKLGGELVPESVGGQEFEKVVAGFLRKPSSRSGGSYEVSLMPSRATVDSPNTSTASIFYSRL